MLPKSTRHSTKQHHPLVAYFLITPSHVRKCRTIHLETHSLVCSCTYSEDDAGFSIVPSYLAKKQNSFEWICNGLVPVDSYGGNLGKLEFFLSPELPHVLESVDRSRECVSSSSLRYHSVAFFVLEENSSNCYRIFGQIEYVSLFVYD